MDYTIIPPYSHIKLIFYLGVLTLSHYSHLYTSDRFSLTVDLFVYISMVPYNAELLERRNYSLMALFSHYWDAMHKVRIQLLLNK